MPRVTCSDGPSWARAACGVPVGRYIESPGSSSTSSWRTRASTLFTVVDLPQLGAVGLEDEDVVAVLCPANPASPVA